MKVLSSVTMKLVLQDPDPVPLEEIRTPVRHDPERLQRIHEEGQAHDSYWRAVRDFKLSGGRV